MKDKKYRLIARTYREFLLPTLAMTMANNMALFVDSVLVSTFLGVARMPAIQLCYPVVSFVNMIYWMVGLGGSLLASNVLSDHDRDKASRIFSVSMASVVLFGALVAGLGTAFAPQVTSLLCRDASLRGEVMEYWGVLVLGMPFLCYIMSLSYFARADGSPKVGFWAVLISNLVNLSMDVVLIKVLGWGLRGAALATIIGYICGALYMLRYIKNKDRQFRFVNPFRGGTYLKDIRSIVVKGFPTASTQLYITLNTSILNAIVTVCGGTLGLQAFSIYNNSLFLAFIIFIGTAQTLSPIVSVYAHEGDYDRARYVLKRALCTALAGACALLVLFEAFPQIILALYAVKAPESVAVCTQAIRLYVFAYPGIAFFFVMTYYFQAIKKETISSVLTALEGFVFPVAFIGLLAPRFHMNGVWAGVILAEMLPAVVILLYLYISKKRCRSPYGLSLMLPLRVDENRYSFTVGMNVREAVKLSEEVESWLRERIDAPTAVRTCLALEEMLTGIVMANSEGRGTIDVVLRVDEQDVIIAMRDMGVGFNPALEDRRLGIEFDNVEVLNKIASEIKYDRSIGMNSTMIRLKICSI